jgi:hypothetical protein
MKIVTLAKVVVFGCLVAVVSTSQAWTLGSADEKGWQTKNLSVFVDTSGCGVSDDVLLPLIDQSLAVWNGVAGADISVSRSATPSTDTSADILSGDATDKPLIACDANFGPDNSSDPSFADQVPASTEIGKDNPLDFAGIMLNVQSGAQANISNLIAQNPTLLVVTIAHEMGHVLGLGHSGSSDALMYYSISNKTQASLTQDDRDGLIYLYPKNELAGGAFGCASVHGKRLESASAGWFTVIFALGIFGMAVSRRLVHFKPQSVRIKPERPL